ncbi:alpha/beta fold hydrolase [Alkalimonas sp.]|uniref:alpha/beta fold hydrolase n=1 Tax=Alkalimonas sp. TaxID=1872453 RepID=UPI00263B5A18|nr:alpha/beta fold hydrolase [Alkalimonas sp.]MCC5825177.1 alpha/beta fold hydrolase [Alkalimonas sp.]
MPASDQLNTENLVQQNWLHHWQPLWQQMQHDKMLNQRGQVLHYSCFRLPNATTAIVISAGRIEMAVKYSAVIFELVQAGYSVYILDHLGQGASARELSNPHKGHICTFDHYSDDWQFFMQQVVIPSQHQRYLALCHSMGSAIFANYLLRYPEHPFAAAVLCSPMLGIYSGPLPFKAAMPVVRALRWLNRLLSSQSWYLPGQGNYRPDPFPANRLTSCPQQYQWLLSLYQAEPTLQLGGVTLDWLLAADQVMQRLATAGHSIELPLLVLQAGADRVVNNKAQQQFVAQRPELRELKVLAGAKHELLLEQASIREQTMHSILQFFARYRAMQE